MASSSDKKKYPPRLYANGRAPIQKKSMNHYCFLSNLKMVEEGVGSDVWEALKNSSVGVIAKFREVDYIWSGKVVHYLLTHQLSIKKPYEIWTLIDSEPIRFSLYEFEEITGLNCAPFEGKKECDIDHKDFWEDMGVSTGDGPCLQELQLVFERCKNWSFDKRRMVGWLCLLSIGIYGISPTSRIPLDSAKRVLDPEVFNSYQWGRVAFTSLIESIKLVTYGVKMSFTLHGCIHVLLIWAYEAITGVGERYGAKRIGEEVPLLSWGGSRIRFRFEDFILKEKKANDGKLRVRNFSFKSEEDTYPKWDDDVEDTKLNMLIEDLRENRLDIRAWDIIDEPVRKMNKRKVIVHETKADVDEDSEVENTTKKKKEDIIARQEIGTLEAGREVSELVTEKAIIGLLDMVKTLTEKVDTMDDNIAKKVLASFDPIIDAKVDAKVDQKLTFVNEKIATLENDVKYLRERLEAGDTKETANSNVNLEEEVTSKSLSWMVQTKPTSQDGLPTTCVVRKIKKASNKNSLKEHKNKKGDTLGWGGIMLTQSTERKEVNRKKGGDIPQEHKKGEATLKKLLNQKSPSHDVVHVTEEHKAASRSLETWSDPAMREKVNLLGAAFDKMIDGISNVNENGKPKLASNVVWHQIGKRINTGVTLSVAAYDPLAVVEKEKLNKLMEFIQREEKEPVATYDSGVEFYKIIITPRDKWCHDTYGWLGDSQICSTMHMFHKRSLRDPSPYHSQRIAFMDQWIVKKWVSDYNSYNPKKWSFPNKYFALFNGVYPANSVTNKKWLFDVDHLYACHFINGNHWVALDIDLQKEKIHVYDSILEVVEDDKEILRYCRPFAKMIPALLNAMVPLTMRKKSEKQFTVKRLKVVPQNKNPGDCGVYALKYIECLAIGCTFEGLSDRNIPALRCKLAAEIFDEVGEPHLPKEGLNDMNIPSLCEDEAEDVLLTGPQ